MFLLTPTCPLVFGKSRPASRSLWRALIVCLTLLLSIWQQGGRAANLQPGFQETVVASHFGRPTAMAFAPDGRLFFCQQGGIVRIVENGVLLPTRFVSVTTNSQMERGLLGIAFDPAFATNHYVYLYYTARDPFIHNRLSRFTADGNVALPGSEVYIIDFQIVARKQHQGGAIHFGPDGKLYLATGDNSARVASQTLNNPWGKILRINADGSIPTDNPFYARTTGINRAIWMLGLRNPYTFSFHPHTGRIFVNDVGGRAWEEIDSGDVAANFGWPTTEGPTTDPAFVSPLFAYEHGDGNDHGNAITGGAFYNPASAQFPSAYMNDYLFSDWSNGWIRSFDPVSGEVGVVLTNVSHPVAILVAEDGSIYYLARGDTHLGGMLVRVTYSIN